MILSSLDARLSGSSRSEALESSDSARCNFCPTRPESRAARVLVIVAGMLDDERACSHKALAKCPTRARALCTLLKQQIWVGRANHKCRSCWRQSPCVLCPASSTQLVLSFLLHCERIMYIFLSPSPVRSAGLDQFVLLGRQLGRLQLFFYFLFALVHSPTVHCWP